MPTLPEDCPLSPRPAENRPLRCRLIERLIIGFSCLLLLFWIIGINTKEAARVGLGLGSIGVLVAGAAALSGEPSRKVIRLFRLFPWAFVPSLAAYQIARVYLGEHGIDFSIFTQVIRSIRDTGVPTTSLVAPESVNFFSHHFSPFLFLLGWGSRISFPPHLIGIVAQVTSIGVGLFFFYRFCRAAGFTGATAGITTTLLCLNPCFRSGVSWGIHDEVFAIGVIGGALYAWVTGRAFLCGLCLVALGGFKETFFIASALGAAAASFSSYRQAGRLERSVVWYALVAAVMGVAAVCYFIVLPLYPELFSMSFRPASRIANVDEIVSFSFVKAKILFLAYLLVPIFGLPFLSQKGVLLWLCAAPFWGASLISNFAEMHKAFNYYAVVPTYVAFFAAALTVKERWGTTFSFTPLSLFVAMGLAFSSGYQASPVKPLKRCLSEPIIVPDSLTMIPQHLSVVASEFDSVFLLDKRRVVRLWIAERLPTSWDVIVVRDKTTEPPSPKLLKGTTLCYRDALWTVYCRPGVRLTEGGEVNSTGP